MLDINLSEAEIRALLVALKHTAKFNDEDYELDQSSRLAAPGTEAWLNRKDQAAQLVKKLTNALNVNAEKATERMMKGTASPTIETLCGNDPVNW
tara:strand:+ start:1896 stop:2180 length:285 start_codon:yes stop_codon:yes gene_type:complete